MEKIASRILVAGRERQVLMGCLFIASLGFYLLAREFAGDAAKATPRLAKAWTDGEWTSAKDYAAFGTHWFALGNAVLLLLAALTAPWWHFPWRDPRGSGENAESSPARRPGPTPIFLGLLLACVILAGGLRWTTATGGLWHDEGLQMKRVSGNFQIDRPDAGGLPTFREAPWTDTLFHFRKPTNHTILGVPSRVCLDLWRSATGAERHEFSEFAFRFPSYLAGLAAVGMVGWLGRKFAGDAAGILAALLLAVHPWHIHWGVDARSYSLGVFSTVLAMAALVAADATGRWRWWLLFGFAQCLLLWASLMHLWLAICLFLAAATMIFLRRRTRPAAPQISRMLLANVAGATLFLQIMGPNLIQFVQASKMQSPADESYMKLDGATFQDFLSHLFLGLPHAVPTLPNDAPITSWESMFDALPVVGWALLATAILLALAGMILLPRHHRSGGLVVLAIALGGLVHLGTTRWLDLYYYPRFSTYLIPVVVLAWAVIWTNLARMAGRGRPQAAWLAIPLSLAVFLLTAWPQAANLVRHSHEPFPEMREFFAEKRAAAPGGRAITACLGLAGDIMQEIYDPRCRFVRTRGEIDALIAEARQSGQPLYIAYGLQSFNRSNFPESFQALDDPVLFSMIERFVSNDPRHTFFIFQLNPAAASGPTP